MCTSSTPAAASASFPAPVATTRVPYLVYIAGTTSEEEPYQELVQELYQGFDEQFPTVLLARILRQQNPLVDLLCVEEADGTIRPDWPYLAHDECQALASACASQLGHRAPFPDVDELLADTNVGRTCEKNRLVYAGELVSITITRHSL